MTLSVALNNPLNGKIFGFCRIEGILRMEQSPALVSADSNATRADYFLVRRPFSPMLAGGCGARGKQRAHRVRDVSSCEGTRRANLRVLAQAGGR